MASARPTSLTLILGLGISGLAMARWCARLGQRVRVADTRAAPPNLQALRDSVPEAEYVAGPLTASLLHNEVGHVVASAVYCSPGLSPAEVASVREAAVQSGVFFGGELDLFSQTLARLGEQHGYRPQVLAITGTNGKTTVTALTGQLLERAGLSVAVAGNIGPSLLDTLAQRLDAAEAAHAAAMAEPAADIQVTAPAETGATVAPSGSEAPADGMAADDQEGQTEEGAAVPPAPPAASRVFVQAMPQVWVLELSSFQLAYSSGFEPTAGVLLNLSQDHLDWHGTAEDYRQAKAKVYGRAAAAVLNRDDEAVMGLLAQLGELPAPATRPGRGQRPPARRLLRFGLQLPEQTDDWGVETVNGLAWLARMQGEAPAAGARGRRGQAAECFLQRLMPADAMRIRGRHNVANALAALALAGTTGAALAPMLHGLREYRGEPHRVQSIGLVGGVEYIDDSKGTNVGATVAALRGLGGQRRLVVILGGLAKGQDFAPLVTPLRETGRAALLIGRDAVAIEQALQDCGVPLQHAPTLEQAVAQAAVLAQPGDAVLLSPACASMDMFSDYAHRAQVFVDSVRALALEAGQELEVWT